MALTFDMGGRIGDSLGIVDWLVSHDPQATIFLTGAILDNRATNAGRTVLGTVDAHPELFDLGNHSYHHSDFRTLSQTEMRAELRITEAAIARLSDRSPRPFFRPPYGGWNSQVLVAVGAAGYSRTMLWDVDTIDWRQTSDGGPTADQIVHNVLTNAHGGSIVLMHMGGYETLRALPRVVGGLRTAGYQLVGLHALLGV